MFEEILRHYPEDDNARLNVGAMLQAGTWQQTFFNLCLIKDSESLGRSRHISQRALGPCADVLSHGCIGGADGRFDEALVVYDEWLVRRPDTVAALNNKAAILLNSGREEQV